MENGVQALMIAFAVLVFVIALTVTFSTLAQAKQTADVVIKYSDREYFQAPLEVEYGSETISAIYQEGGRVVNVDTIIATIARCIKEKFSVKILDTNDAELYVFEYDVSTKKEIEQKIKSFITEFVDNKSEFKETYSEIITSGNIYTGEDGTTLEENTGKKLYIVYKKIGG